MNTRNARFKVIKAINKFFINYFLIMEHIIYHFTTPDYFNLFKDKEYYYPQRYHEEGFIHNCFERQQDHVRNNYFQGIKNIVILKIDTRLLEHPLIIEEAKNGDSFPHIYGELNLNAVVEKIDFLNE